MDDMMSTPISSLKPSIPQPGQMPPPPEMQSQQPQTYYESMTQGSALQPPQHQPKAFGNPGFVHGMHNQQQKDITQEKQAETFDVNQKEMMFLFVIVSLIISEPIQKQLMTFFPSLFDNTKPSLLANMTNAGLVCGAFFLLRNIKVQF